LECSGQSIVCFHKAKGEVVPILNYAPHYEDVLEVWRCSSTNS